MNVILLFADDILLKKQDRRRDSF